jgi:hypothetical protein
MTRYKEVYEMMVTQNKAEFDKFQILHDEYALNPEAMQEEYNNKGKKIQEIIRKYEDILCGHSEKSGYGSYTGSLAEKFHEEILKHYPKIDHIGIKMTKRPVQAPFEIKKINL